MILYNQKEIKRFNTISIKRNMPIQKRCESNGDFDDDIAYNTGCALGKVRVYGKVIYPKYLNICIYGNRVPIEMKTYRCIHPAGVRGPIIISLEKRELRYRLRRNSLSSPYNHTKVFLCL